MYNQGSVVCLFRPESWVWGWQISGEATTGACFRSGTKSACGGARFQYR